MTSGGKFSSSSGFVYPWQHSFPPFFTLQIHQETKIKQLESWRSLILDFCQKNKITSFEVVEIINSPLFHNKEINRRLSSETAYIIFEDLEAHGHLEWMDKSRKRCHIYWRTPEEWGSLIYNWAKENAMTNAVCTLYELTEGDDVADQPFFNLEEDMLIKALKSLELQKKAEIFGNNEGVKFF